MSLATLKDWLKTLAPKRIANSPTGQPGSRAAGPIADPPANGAPLSAYSPGKKPTRLAAPHCAPGGKKKGFIRASVKRLALGFSQCASALIVEAKLEPANVAFIQVGLPVTVKLYAYDYFIFGSMRGGVSTISYLSADTLTEDTRQSELIYWRVQIRIQEHEFKGQRATSIAVRPGLTTSMEIQTGQRSVLSYLSKPIGKN